jgi:hypothetical protein
MHTIINLDFLLYIQQLSFLHAEAEMIEKM